MNRYALIALLLIGCGDDAKKVLAENKTVDVDDLEVGACGAPVGDGFVSEFEVMPCVVAHPMEVAGRYELTDAEFPGASALRLDANIACRPFFQQYIGVAYGDSDYDIQTLVPSPSSWAAGDRSVVCFVVDPEGAPLESLARGSQQ